MNRRDLLKFITAATGVAFVGGKALAYENLPMVPLSDTGFSKEDVAFFNELGEVILPRTDTPGAKDADVGSCMAVLVADCYHPTMQKTFKEGLVTLKKRAEKEYGKDFLLLSAEQKMELLSSLDEEAKAYNAKKGIWGDVAMSNPNAGAPWDEELVAPHYFSLIKQLVLFSFFTSEVGSTKVLRYVAIPTKYEDIPYKKGDRAWAT